MKTHTFFLTLCFLALLSLGFVEKPTASYTLDMGHTHIGFEVERFMVGEVTGAFNEFAGTISMEGEDVTTLAVNATIQTNSLDSHHSVRDGHLKGEMWLHTEKYPEIVFVSTHVTTTDDDGYVMHGKLTIRGITKSIEFPLEVLGPLKDPTQKIALGLKADLEINRFDYGIQFNKKLDNGSLFIGDMVKIKLRALAYKE